MADDHDPPYAEFGYDFNAHLRVEDLKRLASRLGIHIQSYKGKKPLKPDYVWYIELHFAIKRVTAGTQPTDYLHPSFDVGRYYSASLRQVLTAHGYRYLDDGRPLCGTRVKICDLQSLFADKIYEIRFQVGYQPPPSRLASTADQVMHDLQNLSIPNDAPSGRHQIPPPKHCAPPAAHRAPPRPAGSPPRHKPDPAPAIAEHHPRGPSAQRAQSRGDRTAQRLQRQTEEMVRIAMTQIHGSRIADALTAILSFRVMLEDEVEEEVLGLHEEHQPDEDPERLKPRRIARLCEAIEAAGSDIAISVVDGLLLLAIEQTDKLYHRLCLEL